MLQESTQGGARAPNWRTFAVKMPLLKASRFLNAFWNGFQCFFEGPTLRIVWYLPVQISFPTFAKDPFFVTFWTLLAPNMLTFGTHWRPEGD